MMIQLVSVLGAITILAAYAANQFGRLQATGLLYAVANIVGAAILSYVAAHERQWGFLLLDGKRRMYPMVVAPRRAGSSTTVARVGSGYFRPGAE